LTGYYNFSSWEYSFVLVHESRQVTDERTKQQQQRKAKKKKLVIKKRGNHGGNGEKGHKHGLEMPITLTYI
jgi:hypothetical protein